MPTLSKPRSRNSRLAAFSSSSRCLALVSFETFMPFLLQWCTTLYHGAPALDNNRDDHHHTTIMMHIMINTRTTRRHSSTWRGGSNAATVRHKTSPNESTRRSNMSRVVRFHRLGGPEVLQIEEVPDRALKEGELRVRIE